jgi:hypothetical protein
MQKIMVFRFRYVDRATGTLTLAEDWATPQAIAQLGGIIEADTGMEVEASQVSAVAGLMMRKPGAA